MKEMRTAFVLVVFSFVLSACDNPFEKEIQDAKSSNAGADTNKDATQALVFTVGSVGTDFTVNATSTAVEFNLPDVSSTARGVLTSAKLAELESQLGPNGNTAFVTSRAIERKGFAQIVASLQQTIPSAAGSSLAVAFDTPSRLDQDYFSFDPSGAPTVLTVDTAGSYHLRYSVGVTSGGNSFQSFRCWIEVNGAAVPISYAYGTTRNATDTKDETIAQDFLITLSAGDALSLHVQGRTTATWGSAPRAGTGANAVLLLVERI